MMPLTTLDFPIYSVGPLVYRRTESSPFMTASSDALAWDIAMRLNRDHALQFGTISAATPDEGTYIGGGLIAVKSV